MPPQKLRELTVKQRAFIEKIMEREGNAQMAALEVYDVEKPLTAGVIASQNLKKPAIRNAILKRYEKVAIDWWNQPENIKKSIAFDAEKATRQDTRLKAKELLAKTHGMFIEKRVNETRVLTVFNIQAEMSTKSVSEIVNGLTDRLLNGAPLSLEEQIPQVEVIENEADSRTSITETPQNSTNSQDEIVDSMLSDENANPDTLK